MATLRDIRPFIRVAHHYRFGSDSNTLEKFRLGYCYAFHLFGAGKGVVCFRGRSYPLSNGTVVSIPPGEPHSFQTDPDNPVSSYNIYCELWAEHVQNSGVHLVWGKEDFDPRHLTAVQPCWELESIPTVMQLHAEHPCSHLFRYIVLTWLANDAYAGSASQSALYTLILELFRGATTQAPYDHRIQRIIHQIDECPGRPPDIAEWMQKSGLKKTQFFERFRIVAGLTPTAYSLRARMRLASTELLESTRSVTEIAELLGYSSIHYFSQQFKSYFGYAPTEYRRRGTS